VPVVKHADRKSMLDLAVELGELAEKGSGAEAPAAPPAPTPTKTPTTAPAAAGGEAPGGLIPAAPSVRRLARELGVDLKAVQGSGILGRISAEDVRAYAEGGAPRGAAPAAAASAPQPAPLPDFSTWGETERVAMNGIRKATVRSMTTAWTTVPMVTHFDKADATEFEALRKRHKSDAEALGAKLTPTAMLIKVVAAALRKFPDFNASIDVANNEIVYKKYVNVGVAVDTDHGLLVPVVKHADRKSMLDLAVELGELAEKARDRKLTPDEMQGGNFSVSNLGGIGGTGFTPIVAPPDVAILGVSRGGKEPVWDEEKGTFVPRMMMPLSVTYDHRLIDGASAARFLRWICRAIENPFLISLEG
jgi:pyruvate dehydrogenase E2 component (dihydrolipoamide acetyltransferase)